MSIAKTPVITDSETIETLKLADEISTFLEDQKLKAQDRIRKCEAFVNNLYLPSKSVKEGLARLRQNAEDDYSELLHLERVLIMRDGGDFIPSLQTPIIPANIATPFEKSPPRFTRTSSSGDPGRLSDGGSNKSKSARISKDNQFTRNIDDDHGTGEGFEMGRKSSDGRYNSDLEENFDPLQESFFSLEKKNDQNDNNTIKVTNDTAKHIKKANNVHHDDIYIENDPEKPYQEEDEEEDYFHEKEPSQARVIGIRQNPNTNSAQNMARSLPVSVPLPEGLPKRGEIFDLPSDEEGDEDSDIDTEGHPIGRRKSAIPEKIAQIAKSMYDRDNLGFGDLPRGNKPRKY